MPQVAVSYGIGGLNATIFALAIEQVLRDNSIEVTSRCGVSGGSIAAACMSFTQAQLHGPQFVAERISKIPQKDIQDETAIQQLIDRIRKIPIIKKLVGTRKGDKPMLGWYSGKGLYKHLGLLFEELGEIATPVTIISTSLDSSIDNPDRAVLKTLSMSSRKQTRLYSYSSNTISGIQSLQLSVRASCSIPLVFEPTWVDDHYEMDGGCLSLTGEEVATDYILAQPESNRPKVLVVADLQSLPEQTDNTFDDVIEEGTAIVRAIGSHMQYINSSSTNAKLIKNNIGLMRFYAPKISHKPKQFDTSSSVQAFQEYVTMLKHEDKMIKLLEYLRGSI